MLPPLVMLVHFLSFHLLVALALATSPSGLYAPGSSTCPKNSSLIREANSISDAEADWVQLRHEKTDLAVLEFVENALDDFDPSLFDQANLSVNIAIAFSGGGLRAMLSGAGQLAALDNRTTLGDLGGVLQSATYIAGLSGGAWLLGLLAMQNFPSIDEVVLEDPYNVWDFTASNSLLRSSNLIGLGWAVATNDYDQAISYLRYWNTPQGEGIGDNIEAKENAGFPTSVTDAWGRALAHQLFPEGNNNWLSGATWSDIRRIRAFANHQMPFPLVTALARRPGSVEYNLNSPIVEFNPFEMGLFDTSINTFHDIKYIGTKVNNGLTNGTCVQGFDNTAFVVGTSSSLFNQYLNTLVCDECNTNAIVKFFLRRFLLYMSRERLDVALYLPNPFYGSEYANSGNITASDTLYLIDGGLAGEIIPLSTLMVTERNLDLVFAYDNNGPEWPNGESIINTYERQFTYEGRSTVCPYVPGESTFGHFNLSSKPTFFGCDAANLTALTKNGVVPPIVVYTANRPFEYYSNTSTSKLTYTDNEKKGMVTNGIDTASQLNGTYGNLQVCVACAMIRREEERQGKEQSDQCKECFQQYCWDGQTYEDPEYYPPVNFTGEGLTNDSMTLWGDNAYIEVAPSSTTLIGTIFTWIKMLF